MATHKESPGAPAGGAIAQSLLKRGPSGVPLGPPDPQRLDGDSPLGSQNPSNHAISIGAGALGAPKGIHGLIMGSLAIPN